MGVLFRLFSVCPRLTKSTDKLVGVTPWRLRILTLGWFYRRISIDPKREEVIIYRRYFWAFARRRRLRFGAIKAVTYGYQDLAIGAYLSWAHDTVDLYSVGLRLHRGDEVHLFSFFGDGTFSNNGPWPEWLYWDNYVFDMSGTQQRESRAFAELLVKMMDVTVMPARS